MAADDNITNELEALRRRVAELEAAQNASVNGSGALAQGSGFAMGERSVKIDGPNSGEVNTGTKTIETQGGHYISRDFVQYVTEITQAGDDPEEVKSVIALYLHALAIDLAGLRLGEIDASTDQARQTPLELADIYVPLDTTLRIPEKVSLADYLAPPGIPARAIHVLGNESRPASALEALAQHRELTILGKPGSGKSTFGASVLLTFALAWQGHDDELSKFGEHWTHGPLLPIRVILRRFAESLPAGDAPARAGDIWAFIAEDLQAGAYGLSADAMQFVQRIARKHGALILLDGLDECGDATRRARVLAGVQELMRSAGKKCRFILTARPYAWPGGAEPAAGVYALADLTDEQVEQFIRAWYAALVKRNWRQPGDAERKIQDLLGAKDRQDLRPMTRNPLLLTLMAALHTNRGNLPDDRADLYNESVELLLLRWNQKSGADRALLDALGIPGLKLSSLRTVLEKLAFEVHEASSGSEGAADIGEDRLVRAFRPLLNNSKDKADLVVSYIETRAGLLLGQGEREGERQFTFPHRTFQEFLAACHLAARLDFPAECARLATVAPAQWQVALPLAARIAKAERGASAADQLIDSVSIEEFSRRQPPTSSEWSKAHLAGAQLLEIGLGDLNTDNRLMAIAERVKGWLKAGLALHPEQGGLPAIQRAQMGDHLAALGDPRFDARRFHLPADDTLGFVYVPADPEFRIGTRKRDAPIVTKVVGGEISKDEFNEKITPSPDFYISRYAVTVAQFRAFVAATGFEMGDAAALNGAATRPVARVSWHEALAYCEWLGRMLATSDLFADSKITGLLRAGGWRLTLPSELEWEKAARGSRSNTIFSWGNTPDPERANYDETGINDTLAVGSFPPNDFGLHDMLGNTFEWTCSLWGPYPYGPHDTKREDLHAGDDKERVVRGGSGTAVGAPRAVPIAAGIIPSSGSTIWAFGWCCVLPLFCNSALRTLCTPISPTTPPPEGVRGSLPPQTNFFRKVSVTLQLEVSDGGRTHVPANPRCRQNAHG